MRRRIASILDIYFKHPFWGDLIIIIIILLVLFFNKDKIHEIKDSSKIDNVIGNIISSMISLAGFILASLTIIVTVKSNIKLKKIEDSDNGLELLLTSENYKKIVSVFRDSIIELIFALIVMYGFWSPIFELSRLQYLLLIAFGIIVIALTIARTLAILFRLIFLEFKTKQ